MITISKCMSFTAQKEYGEYKHKLSISEMPSHRHGTNNGWWGFAKWDYRDGKDKEYYTLMNEKTNPSNDIYGNDFAATNYVGNNNFHNNIQPSLVMYFWKRIT